MLSSVVKHLCVGVDDTTHQHLVESVDGTVLTGSSDHPILYQQILEQWPHSIIINSHDQNFSADWCFRLRSKFAVAEIPLVVILHQTDSELEEQLSLLPRLSVFHAHEENLDTLTMFVEMLVDEYTRDPFYEKQPNLQTIHRISQIWIKQQSAQITYGRLNDTGDWTSGYRLVLHRGGVIDTAGIEKLTQALCDPHPTIVQTDHNQMGDWLGVGEALYLALTQSTRPGFLRLRQWYSLQPNGAQADVAKDLPLSLPTRKLLFAKHTSTESIAQRLRNLEIRSMQVETELEILVRLGLYLISPTDHHDPLINTGKTPTLPEVPPTRWPAFIKQTRLDIWQQIHSSNLWDRFHWNCETTIEAQYTQTLKRLQDIEQSDSLTNANARRDWHQIYDILGHTKNVLQRWEHVWIALGGLDDSEQLIFSTALDTLKLQQYERANQILKKQEHPLLQGLQTWTASIVDHQHKQPHSVRTHLMNLDSILCSIPHPLPLFEAYKTVMYMMLEQWSMAKRQAHQLPNSHQTRALQNAIQKRQISQHLWVFRAW